MNKFFNTQTSQNLGIINKKNTSEKPHIIEHKNNLVIFSKKAGYHFGSNGNKYIIKGLTYNQEQLKQLDKANTEL